MLKRLRMVGWKSFEDAELLLGPFTLLVGANASGKSNVREALRFLHAVGRGYNLAEIFGGKYSAGERQWSGIRGGVREAAFRGAASFALEVETIYREYLLNKEPPRSAPIWTHYRLEVERATDGSSRVVAESLQDLDRGQGSIVYEATRTSDKLTARAIHWVIRDALYSVDAPILTRLPWLNFDGLPAYHDQHIDETTQTLRDMRFIDPSPDAMRQASMPGQTILSDRGENLSSVLQSLCSHEETKSEIIHWLRALTPMDVADLEFDVDRRGQVLLILVEKDGTEISADSASEGTLRFLGLLAALMSPESGLYFFEEIENGLHPSRIRLLLDLIEERTRGGKLQVVATTHSPALLALLPDELLEYASLVVRPEEARSSRILRLLDVPDAPRVLREHDRGELFASGWFEDMVEFGESKKPAAEIAGAPS